MLKLRSHIALPAAVLLVAGCASTPPPPPPPPLHAEALQYEQQAAENIRNGQPAIAVKALERALHLHALLDNVNGQFRVGMALARRQVLAGEDIRARQHVERAAQLLPDVTAPDAAYQLHLMRGRTGDGAVAFEQALDSAVSDVGRAVALTYLGRETEAWALLAPADDTSPANRREASEIAFVALSYALATGDTNAAEAALAHYRSAEDPVGLSDALFLLGTMHETSGRTDAARRYFLRATIVNTALGDERRATASEQRLKQLQNAGGPHPP